MGLFGKQVFITRGNSPRGSPRCSRSSFPPNHHSDFRYPGSDDFRDRLCSDYSKCRNYAHNYAYTIDDSLSLVLRATFTIQYVIRLLFVLTARSKVHWKRYCYPITPMLAKRPACIASVPTTFEDTTTIRLTLKR